MRWIFCVAILAVTSLPGFGASCESLAGLSLPDTNITQARQDGSGDLPAFCRVAATLKPTPDSDIKIEVWLPVSGWNGKYQAVGNGGWSGSINTPAMAQALQHGYATSSTDTGHTGSSASFALGHPEKLIDYAYRSEHEMTVKAKAIIAAFYGNPPKLSYWNGCSAGGKQALKEAQRFPDDFNGIIAGAPANNWTGRAEEAIWIAQAVHNDPASYIPPEKYRAIHEAAVAACDTIDGVKDGIMEDPTRCHFDPKVIECKGADGPACLTTPQVEAARKIYSGAVNPRTKQQVAPGFEPGSELGWGTTAGPQPFGIANEHFKNVVFRNPAWDYRTLNFDTDIAMTEKMDNGLINALDPNLKPFFAHGGKLVQYHGWNDWQIEPRMSVNYYQSVLEAMGGASKVRDSYRLFMAPGMGHCGGSEGPNTFDMMGMMEQWVEQGKAPDKIVAARMKDGKIDRTRPLCPYPQTAKYKGSGSIDDASNFACAAP
ncbi:MAG TPA: tannase/feruloyl esterase family alpha/beta hydrolase [Bryobacteraceae bacterium]|nr:tannase/feruloyl esterase family alpha/beta hydrolase [Bryobacteraceae bacterium]